MNTFDPITIADLVLQASLAANLIFISQFAKRWTRRVVK